MHYFYREMDFRETEKPTLVSGRVPSTAVTTGTGVLRNPPASLSSGLPLDLSELRPLGQ